MGQGISFLSSYKLEYAYESMKRFGLNSLLSPASLTREFAFLATGFILKNDSLEKIGGHFSRSASLATTVLIAEILAQRFWSQFLPQFEIKDIRVQSKIANSKFNLTYRLLAQEREDLLTDLKGPIEMMWSLRTSEGLIVGQIILQIHTRLFARLSAPK